MKVMTIVGTRPEIIKLSCVIHELDRTVRHVLVHTGQNYDPELSRILFDGMRLRAPDYALRAAGGTAVQTVARVLERIDPVLAKEAPDAVLVLGDTNSCLAAIAAKRRRIPVFHMEAGNRSYDERVPEEVNRRILDHISDINMPYTEHARRNLLAEGIRGETVIKTGSPMKQVLASQSAALDASKVLLKLGLEQGRFFVVSAHREETVDDPRRLGLLLQALAAVQRRHRLPMIFSTHPRTRARLGKKVERSRGIRFLRPLGFADYIHLQRSAFCVISDSGTLTEEASILGFPAVMVRESHERPEGMDEGTLIMAGLRPPDVLKAVRTVTERRARLGRVFKPHTDYDVDDVASKVVNVILSYTGYVNRVVWRRPG